jgi:hypothetical protein
MSLGTLRARYSYQSDNNSNTDDADLTDLRGFSFAVGKSFLATNDTNFHKLAPKLRLSEIPII